MTNSSHMNMWVTLYFIGGSVQDCCNYIVTAVLHQAIDMQHFSLPGPLKLTQYTPTT